jgi:hypothetical protein
MLGWDRYGFDKKHARTRYAELVFLHLVGSMGHIVHCGAFGVRNVDPPFSSSSRPGAVSIKSAYGHVMPNLWFLIQ